MQEMVQKPKPEATAHDVHPPEPDAESQPIAFHQQFEAQQLADMTPSELAAIHQHHQQILLQAQNGHFDSELQKKWASAWLHNTLLMVVTCQESWTQWYETTLCILQLPASETLPDLVSRIE